jgi:uncharacterized protein (TIGR03435 family)
MMMKRFEPVNFFKSTRAVGRAASILAAVALHIGCAAQAQQTPSPKDLDALIHSATFEVASIRADKPSPDGRITSRIGFLPDGTFTATGITLKKLFCLANDVEDFQVSGAADWFSSDRYTIEAKADTATQAELPKVAPDQQKQIGQHMMQLLLADRLKLQMHEENKEFPILALVVAKSGLKLHESTPGDTYPNGLKDRNGSGHAGMMRFSNGKVTAQGVPLDKLANQLTEALHQIVQNKTGLKGKYDFTLDWTPDEDHDGGPLRDNGAPAADPSGPGIFTALQEQLGLKLESQKSAIPVFVVDHVERPSEN